MGAPQKLFGMPVGSFALRSSLFLIFWLMISGWAPSDLPIGLAAVAAATWNSLFLLPPGRSRLRIGRLARLATTFAWQSIVSGIDVARRAFERELRLHQGIVPYRVQLSSSVARNTFYALSSLLPGTLPTGTDEEGSLLVHCLDIDRPVAADLAREEDLFRQVLGDE